MTDYPIIFSGAMVRALLGGRKTMTRRLAWRVPRPTMIQCPHGFDTCPTCDARKPSPWQKVVPGDRLWVRENFWFAEVDDNAAASWPQYVADDNRPPPGEPMIPSIHMPRRLSRLTLIVNAKKLEPLQAISDADAQAEGIVEDDGSEPDIWYVPGAACEGWNIQMANRPSKVFPSLWTSLHGPGSWEANPDVVALGLRVIKANIDAPEAQAA